MLFVPFFEFHPSHPHFFAFLLLAARFPPVIGIKHLGGVLNKQNIWGVLNMFNSSRIKHLTRNRKIVALFRDQNYKVPDSLNVVPLPVNRLVCSAESTEVELKYA